MPAASRESTLDPDQVVNWFHTHSSGGVHFSGHEQPDENQMMGRRLWFSRVSLVGGLYLVASTAPRVASFLLLPAYAFVLSPEELAAYGIAVSLAQLIGILSDAGILAGVARTYWDQPEADRPSYLKSTVLLSRVVSLSILVPIGFLLAVIWDPLFGSGLPKAEGLLLILAFAFLQRGNNLAGALYRARRAHRQFAVTRVLPAAVQVVAGGLMVFVLGWGSLGAVAAAPVGFLCSLVVAGLRPEPGERVALVRLSRKQAILLFTQGAPVLPVQLARWAQLLSLRPLLGLFSTLSQTASFTFSNAPAQIVAPFSEAYEQYLAPRYYESGANGDIGTIERLRGVTSAFMGLGAVGTIMAIVVFDPLFVYLAPEPYRNDAGLAAIALAGIVMTGQMTLLVHGLRVEDRQGALVAAVLVGVTVSYSQFFALVQVWGAWSAAVSVYLYPAATSVFMLLARGDRRMRLVASRDWVITNLGVLGVLACMLLLRLAPGSSLDHALLLSLPGLVGVAVVVVLVLRRHVPVVVDILREGGLGPSGPRNDDVSSNWSD